MLGVALCTPVVFSQAPQFIIDDDQYIDQVTTASARLVRQGKLKPLKALQEQLHTKTFPFRQPAIAQQKLSPPDLCERLRESTLAVGTIFKCADCGNWHFDSSAGFVIAEGGVVCTCCHVIVGEDCASKEAYFVVADSTGKVFPVQAVLAADTESDTCLIKTDAVSLKPLPIRAHARAGERVYCLSHPGGYHFMFTEGMIARLNLRRNDVLDERGQTSGELTRPVLFLNITAEFAPGSSGAPIVDEAGNVVGQVASIADAGEPEAGDEHSPPSPSVPIRFCTAAEEILRLATSYPDQQAKQAAPVRAKAKQRTHVGH
jgi:S1-C subfamily serine protease